MVLGLTGPLCSGKSTAADFFRRCGWRVIDVDRLGYAILRSPSMVRAIRKRLGERVVTPRGRIDRKRLGEIVFADSAALRWLNALMHPPMRAAVRERLSLSGSRKTVLDAALLHQMGLSRFCDAVLLVTAPRKILAERGLKSRGYPPERVRFVLRAQALSVASVREADIRIINDATKAAFIRNLRVAEFLLAGYCRKS